MPCGVLFMGIGNPNLRGYRSGDLVRVCRAIECREDPAPGTPIKILILSDAETAELETLCQERPTLDGRTLARSLCFLDVASLPSSVQTALQNRGRATCTKAEFLAAAFHKELGLSLAVTGLPTPRTIRKVDRTKDELDLRDREARLKARG